jgi:hypothetical protein
VLNIYPVVIEFASQLRPLLAQIERKDRDLGKQLRRAAASVALIWGRDVFARGTSRGSVSHCPWVHAGVSLLFGGG